MLHLVVDKTGFDILGAETKQVPKTQSIHVIINKSIIIFC